MSEETNDLTLIQSELNAPKNQYNKFGDYNYRNCEDIQSALKPLLLKYKCGLSISDSIEVHGDRIYIVGNAIFTDSKGTKTEVKAYARESDNKKGMSSEQVSGSASSYARKYALGGLFLIDDQKDPDSMDNSKTQVTSNKPSGPDAVLCPPEYLKPEYIEKNWNGKIYANNTFYLNNTKFIIPNPEWVEWFKNHPKYKPEAK